MSNNLSPITNYWSLPTKEQSDLRKIAIPSAPKCEECGAHPVQPRKCRYCKCVICSACTRHETWGDKPITVCKTCHEAGKELDALIESENKARENSNDVK